MRTSVDSYQELSEHEKKLVVASLRELLEACRDDQSGYGQASVDVREESLQPIFEEYARQRGEFAEQIENLLDGLGHPSQGAESFRGKLHRKWMDVRTAIESNNAVPMLSECERGEWSTIRKYESALDKVRFPLVIEGVLIDQLAAMRDAYHRLDRMRA